MFPIYPLRGVVQSYEWGSRTELARLLRTPSPSPDPQAELWLGAHPRSPASVLIGGRWTPLDRAIASDPAALLGPGVASRFGELPFLLKVLAAERPLSLQAHPDRALAEAGFARENALGIALDAPDRSYKDPRHKPEMLCALTRFRGLCGFRPVDRIVELFEALDVAELRTDVAALRRAPDPAGLERFFTRLVTWAPAARESVASAALAAARERRGRDPAFAWVVELAAAYPGDLGILAPLYLQRIELAPGEAICLRAGELHSYLGGVGIEVMANSDNVLRGGLTPKHVNVPELLRTLRFRSAEPHIVRPLPDASGEQRYPTWAEEFALAELRPAGGRIACAPTRGPEVLLCIEGDLRISDPDGRSESALAGGDAAFVAASAGAYLVGGDGVAYRAFVAGF